jgi:hypothetical protein
MKGNSLLESGRPGPGSGRFWACERGYLTMTRFWRKQVMRWSDRHFPGMSAIDDMPFFKKFKGAPERLKKHVETE